MGTAPFDTSIEAEYKDGFVLSESELDDVSPYDKDANVFHAVLNKRPEGEHGPLVRFSCFWHNQRYDVDWTTLPESARPIRFRHGYHTRSIAGAFIESGFSGVDFGFQYNNDDGSNKQEVIELR